MLPERYVQNFKSNDLLQLFDAATSLVYADEKGSSFSTAVAAATRHCCCKSRYYHKIVCYLHCLRVNKTLSLSHTHIHTHTFKLLLLHTHKKRYIEIYVNSGLEHSSEARKTLVPSGYLSIVIRVHVVPPSGVVLVVRSPRSSEIELLPRWHVCFF